MLHDDYVCLVESGKQQIKEVRGKFNRKTWKHKQLLSESGFVLRIAPPLRSCVRKIKMKKSNQTKRQTQKGGLWHNGPPTLNQGCGSGSWKRSYFNGSASAKNIPHPLPHHSKKHTVNDLINIIFFSIY